MRPHNRRLRRGPGPGRPEGIPDKPTPGGEGEASGLQALPGAASSRRK
jgi:hypothetical protein